MKVSTFLKLALVVGLSALLFAAGMDSGIPPALSLVLAMVIGAGLLAAVFGLRP